MVDSESRIDWRHWTTQQKCNEQDMDVMCRSCNFDKASNEEVSVEH